MQSLRRGSQLAVLAALSLLPTVAHAQAHDCRIGSMTIAIGNLYVPNAATPGYALRASATYHAKSDGAGLNPAYCPDQQIPNWSYLKRLDMPEDEHPFDMFDGNSVYRVLWLPETLTPGGTYYVEALALQGDPLNVFYGEACAHVDLNGVSHAVQCPKDFITLRRQRRASLGAKALN